MAHAYPAAVHFGTHAVTFAISLLSQLQAQPAIRLSASKISTGARGKRLYTAPKQKQKEFLIKTVNKKGT
jgi:hypothetical protein